MKVLVDYFIHCSTTRSSFSFDLTSCLVSLRGILLAEYKILYGNNVTSQAADDHVQCVLQKTLIPYKILYSARRMPRKLTKQLVRSKEAADVARYSAYVSGRLHIPAGQRTCTLCTGHHRADTTWNPRLHWTRCLASEFTMQTSIQLTIWSGDWYKNASIRQRFGHRWSEAVPYLCLGWAEAKRRW